MRVLFAGTPEFAVPALELIARRFPVAGVLTQAEAPRGRGRKTAPSPVKLKALDLGLTVYEPAALDAAFEKTVRSLGADILVSAAYGRIFRASFLELFPTGGVNVHPSLLPRFRGPSPIQAAILAGDASTGVTIQRLALKMDTGDILAQSTHPLRPDDTAATLTSALAGIGAELCVAVLDRIAAGTERARPQDNDTATYCRLITKESGLVDFSRDAAAISRMIRAYLPWPLAYSFWKGKRVFLLSGGVYPGTAVPAPAPPGTVAGMDKERGILIHTGNGILCITRIQLEYKKALPFRDFMNGNRDFAGSRLGSDGGTADESF
jgi:methionyl-tRNA formyltransferase